MTQQQIIREFKRFSKAEKSSVIRELLQIFEEDLTNEKTANGSSGENFEIDALRLSPRKNFDFDNIGKLIEEIEGEFHR